MWRDVAEGHHRLCYRSALASFGRGRRAARGCLHAGQERSKLIRAVATELVQEVFNDGWVRAQAGHARAQVGAGILRREQPDD
eukprot:8859136-Alexandrium_andersonii.AAC.1